MSMVNTIESGEPTWSSPNRYLQTSTESSSIESQQKGTKPLNFKRLNSKCPVACDDRIDLPEILRDQAY